MAWVLPECADASCPFGMKGGAKNQTHVHTDDAGSPAATLTLTHTHVAAAQSVKCQDATHTVSDHTHLQQRGAPVIESSSTLWLTFWNQWKLQNKIKLVFNQLYFNFMLKKYFTYKTGQIQITNEYSIY